MIQLNIKNLFTTTKTLILIVIVITILQINTTFAAAKGTCIVDQLKAEYIDLDLALWKYLNQRQNDKKSQIRKVVDSHRQFIKEHLDIITFISRKYSILERYYEWQLLETDLIHLDGEFGYFKTILNKYARNYDDLIDERSILDLTEEILNDNDTKTKSIRKIFDNIENVMNKQTMYYRATLDARDQLCATNQSAQQFLYSLYSDVAYTELKGYAMMQFSWMMLRIYEKGNFTQESNLMREEFIKRVDRTQNVLREVMKRADRTVWECDPTNHIKGKTYEEITRLLQGYIENEVDMNEDNTCRENCAYYQIGKSHGCFQDLYCAKQQRCTGKLINCQYVDSDMWICPSAFNSTRRYDYIEYENGRVLGDKNKCVRGSSKVDSWWRWLFWHCSYCFCLCDEQGLKSDRYFNLRPSESDIHKNMVITGLRFVKAKRIFHLQIQQGELLPRGNINPETLEWKPIDDYQIFDRNVKSKIDYHTLAWDNRAIDLDDIKGIDPTHIITGVRFRVVGAHLNFEAKLSEYDFENGKLIDPEINSFWQSNDNTDVTGDNRRTPITLRSPDVPTKSIAKSLPRSKHNQYVEFVNSDMDKDAAQTTVPFIDIQAVTSNPPVPLSGVGIYYKGREQYGGFIAPKLITYDFTPHVQSPFKSEEKVRTI